ncbi:hypothetical protein [Arthrobacter sp. NicSoilC5]|uniref:hypothetical protein n=1 Tax=Arthrobacter sp. NicSoilC5 TaxID=2831000 RepID=UPI001CC4FD88|nr:hypothetical protein [Arthrobacter sp. NicSoilC5]BCW79025.1 hypothetical protein NicSoilC5_10440 [Arthrobacter sp. NicSoilC5]
MSPATVPAAVGAILTTVEELDALPPHSVVIADPEGRSAREEDRQLAMQKRSDFDSTPYWFVAKDAGMFDAIASEEAVYRFHYGPFLVTWLPAT